MWRLVHRSSSFPINSFHSSGGSFRRIATDPKLTLFSGQRCSLCDDAKEILNAIKKERPFQLETVDIHAEGQEKWKRRYVYTIPVLHLEGKVVAQGRWNADDVRSAIIGWKASNEESSTTSVP